MFAAYVEYIHSNLLQPGQEFSGFWKYPQMPLVGPVLQKIDCIPETWRPLARTGKISLQTIDFLAQLPEPLALMFQPNSTDGQGTFCALRFIEHLDTSPFAPCELVTLDTETRLALGI